MASDSDNVRNHLEQTFPGKLLPAVDGVLQHIGIVNTYPPEVMNRMVIENYLLGKGPFSPFSHIQGACHEIVITPGSSFGATAVIRTGKLPMVLNEESCVHTFAAQGPAGRDMPNYISW